VLFLGLVSVAPHPPEKFSAEALGCEYQLLKSFDLILGQGMEARSTDF